MSLREVDGPAGRALGAPAGGRARPAGGRSPSCWPETRSAIRPGGRCTSTARRASSAGERRGLPSVYVIQGYTGQLDMWLGARGVRADHHRAARRDVRRRRLPATRSIVFVDAWTSLGGSQFLNSAGTGPLPGLPVRRGRAVRRRALPDAGRVATTAGSPASPRAATARWWCRCSRPDVFGALASHAGDALFECCYLPEFPQRRADAARPLRRLLRGCSSSAWPTADHFDWGRFGAALRDVRAMRCAYSPDPDRPGEALLPFELATGRLIDEVWAAVAGARPGADGAAPRRRAAQHAPDLPRRRPRRTSTSSTSAPRRSPHELTEARRRAHARAVRRQARRHRLPLPGRDPRAGAGARPG